MAASSGNNPGNNIKMDPGFYEETQPQQQQYSGNGQQQVNRLKRTMTLDLNSASNSTRAPAFKRSKIAQQPVLSSPDLHMLKLGSPELERLIIQQQSGNLTTPTPSMIFPRSVTEEQEMYARGFVEALNELHHSDSSQMDGGMSAVTSSAGGSNTTASPPGGTAVSSSMTYTNLEPQQQSNSSLTSIPGISPGGGFTGMGSSCSGGSTSSGASSPVGGHYGASMSPAGMLGIRVKDEPQTVPSLGGNSPPMSPINMECQERIKLERKRQRNRVAASKCRRRKLERISRLEDKVKILKGENTELSSVVNRLKEQVCQLKEQVMDHVHSGCQILAGSSPTSVTF
ncbi:hypothetical protein B566_EDAN008089 [Ephemera danica]|nr:hypothetical protein B566_EDAN008089 [Ephemera danica]